MPKSKTTANHKNPISTETRSYLTMPQCQNEESGLQASGIRKKCKKWASLGYDNAPGIYLKWECLLVFLYKLNL